MEMFKNAESGAFRYTFNY